jgi:hypothetical protein
MPRDYDLDTKAVSGLKPGQGRGKIAGSPEGLGENAPNWRFINRSAPGDGVIRGNPVGIEGEIHRMTSSGLMGAIGRRLGG